MSRTAVLLKAGFCWKQKPENIYKGDHFTALNEKRRRAKG